MNSSGSPRTRKMHTVVVGGGIAGLSAALHLGAREAGGLLLLEREPLCGMAASGRNAGIFRHLEHHESTTILAGRTAAMLPDLSPGEVLMTPTGAVYVAAAEASIEPLASLAARGGVASTRIRVHEDPSLEALLGGGDAGQALLVPGDGVLDVHAIMEAIRKRILSSGAGVRCNTGVAEILVREGRVRGAALESGEVITCRRLVIAAGAWSGALGKTAGAPLSLDAMRRHLVFLQPAKSETAPGRGPVCWRIDEQVYARPEGSGYLASPCDETLWTPAVEPPVEPGVLFDLALRLSRTLPPLAQSEVQRVWACLRTFSADRLPVIGRDPRVEGLYWLAGLGGQGLSMGLAAGELLAEVMAGKPHPLAGVLSPARLLTTERSAP